MTLDEAIKEISEAVEAHKQLKIDLSDRHIAEVLVLKSAKIGADRLAEALEVVLEELKKEKPENILTDAEKAYLSAVIKPFKKDVQYIIKKRSMKDSGEYLQISLIRECFYLPNFKRYTIYKGMKEGKPYSLKELGLE